VTRNGLYRFIYDYNCFRNDGFARKEVQFWIIGDEGNKLMVLYCGLDFDVGCVDYDVSDDDEANDVNYVE
jgi:hypothetical protein